MARTYHENLSFLCHNVVFQPFDNCRSAFGETDNVARTLVEMCIGVEQDVALVVSREVLSDACPCADVGPAEVSALYIDVLASFENADVHVAIG